MQWQGQTPGVLQQSLCMLRPNPASTLSSWRRSASMCNFTSQGHRYATQYGSSAAALMQIQKHAYACSALRHPGKTAPYIAV